MLTKQEARALVLDRISGLADVLPPGDEVIVLDNATIEREWGWVFFYTSKLWHETQEIRYALAGNAPILVEKLTGKLIVTGTARRTEHYIQNYERTGDPHG